MDAIASDLVFDGGECLILAKRTQTQAGSAETGSDFI
jgi:hypothetical protein